MIMKSLLQDYNECNSQDTKDLISTICAFTVTSDLSETEIQEIDINDSLFSIPDELFFNGTRAERAYFAARYLESRCTEINHLRN